MKSFFLFIGNPNFLFKKPRLYYVFKKNHTLTFCHRAQLTTSFNKVTHKSSVNQKNFFKTYRKAASSFS